jgi:protein arginine kinase activator
MQCQNCKNQTATIHLTEITNGHRTETHLCQACAQKQGLAVQTQIPLNELLSTLLSVQPEAAPDDKTPQEEKACPQCGMTLRRFSKETLLGCPQDYEVFEKNLLPLIQRTHNGKTEHCGKVPAASVGPDQDKQIQLANLRRQLDSAVRNEQYETAARLRDQIRNLQ